MINFTPEVLKSLAAKAAAAYNNGNVPLSESIAALALDNELEAQQIKRLVETTNQITYLSSLDDSTDRTTEFEVANYDDVLDYLMPEEVVIEKVASVTPKEIIASTFGGIEKQASFIEEEISDMDKMRTLEKLAAESRRELDSMIAESDDLLVKLASCAEKVRRDPEAIHKMYGMEYGNDMARLAFGMDKVAEHTYHKWPVDDMADVQDLSDTLGMAKEANDKIKALQPKVEEAESLVKEAFAPLAAAALGAARTVASRVASSGLGQRALGAAQSAKSSAQGIPSSVANKAKSTATKIGNTKAGKLGKKTFRAGETIESASGVKDMTRKRQDSWDSLRGQQK